LALLAVMLGYVLQVYQLPYVGSLERLLYDAKVNLTIPGTGDDRIVILDIDKGGRSITALPVKHTIPAVGYRTESRTASLAFTGNTTSCDALWDAVNQIDNLRYPIIETAFSEKEKALALLSKHLCPTLLVNKPRKMKARPQVFLTHLKPGHAEVILNEIEQLLGAQAPLMLQNTQILEL
jgi:ribonuclease BN (tRNA processing enzyme)